VLSWLHVPTAGAYGASKAAAWAMTNVARQGLAPHGIQVAALHAGYMDTNMTAGIDAPKVDPAGAAALALDGVETDLTEILVDDVSGGVKQGLRAPPARPAAAVA
jgi:NAD(P)-dependent dehydrogenase (short-subunit alcohol dehydrogenase family)